MCDRFSFAKLFDQCAQGWVNNIVLSSANASKVVLQPYSQNSTLPINPFISGQNLVWFCFFRTLFFLTSFKRRFVLWTQMSLYSFRQIWRSLVAMTLTCYYRRTRSNSKNTCACATSRVPDGKCLLSYRNMHFRCIKVCCCLCSCRWKGEYQTGPSYPSLQEIVVRFSKSLEKSRFTMRLRGM